MEDYNMEQPISTQHTLYSNPTQGLSDARKSHSLHQAK